MAVGSSKAISDAGMANSRKDKVVLSPSGTGHWAGRAGLLCLYALVMDTGVGWGWVDCGSGLASGKGVW